MSAARADARRRASRERIAEGFRPTAIERDFSRRLVGLVDAIRDATLRELRPAFDAYAPGPVPPAALLAAGWWFRCAECGAELANGRWVRKQGDGYEELVNGHWAVTEACEERAKREREPREKVKKAQESVKANVKHKPKVDGRRRR